MTRSFVIDFDGTVTEDDLLDTIARDFGDPAVYQEVEDGLDAGTMPLREVITREFAPVQLRSTRSSPGCSSAHAFAWNSASSSSGRSPAAGTSTLFRAASTS